MNRIVLVTALWTGFLRIHPQNNYPEPILLLLTLSALRIIFRINFATHFLVRRNNLRLLKVIEYTILCGCGICMWHLSEIPRLQNEVDFSSVHFFKEKKLPVLNVINYACHVVVAMRSLVIPLFRMAVIRLRSWVTLRKQTKCLPRQRVRIELQCRSLQLVAVAVPLRKRIG